MSVSNIHKLTGDVFKAMYDTVDAMIRVQDFHKREIKTLQKRIEALEKKNE